MMRQEFSTLTRHVRTEMYGQIDHDQDSFSSMEFSAHKQLTSFGKVLKR